MKNFSNMLKNLFELPNGEKIVLYEFPQPQMGQGMMGSPMMGSPMMGNPMMGNPMMGNPMGGYPQPPQKKSGFGNVLGNLLPAVGFAVVGVLALMLGGPLGILLALFAFSKAADKLSQYAGNGSIIDNAVDKVSNWITDKMSGGALSRMREAFQNQMDMMYAMNHMNQYNQAYGYNNNAVNSNANSNSNNSANASNSNENRNNRGDLIDPDVVNKLGGDLMEDQPGERKGNNSRSKMSMSEVNEGRGNHILDEAANNPERFRGKVVKMNDQPKGNSSNFMNQQNRQISSSARSFVNK